MDESEAQFDRRLCRVISLYDIHIYDQSFVWSEAQPDNGIEEDTIAIVRDEENGFRSNHGQTLI